MIAESIELLNLVKRDALGKNDTKTVERVNGILLKEGHVVKILDYTKWLSKATGGDGNENS